MQSSRYSFVIAGNIDRDGQIVEAWEGENQVAELFCAYRSDETAFWCEKEVPLAVVEEMIDLARENLPSTNTYNFLLRKG